MIDNVTLVIPYYDNAEMLARQIAEWCSYDSKHQDRVRFIVIDDGSERHPALDVLRRSFPGQLPIDLQLFRIDVNIPWNQDGARNLGMLKCKTVWALMTDMDHVLPSTQVRALLEFDARPGSYYMPDQFVTLGYSLNRPHPNTFLMSRSDFWTVGGYDEDFAGFYGSDGNFRKCARNYLSEIGTKDFHLVVFRSEDIFDANTKDWGRKDSPFHAVHNEKLRLKRQGPPYRAANPIRFPYTRVY